MIDIVKGCIKALLRNLLVTVRQPIQKQRILIPMPDSRSFRHLMGCFATGVSVISAFDNDQQPVGITISSLTSVSLSPLLTLFCLEKTAQLYSVFRQTKSFAVNILAEDQEDVSRYFADHKHHAKPPKLWDKPQGDCPILRGTLGWMVCHKTTSYKGGDHTIFIGETVKLFKRSGQREPLLYLHGKYRKIGLRSK